MILPGEDGKLSSNLYKTFDKINYLLVNDVLQISSCASYVS